MGVSGQLHAPAAFPLDFQNLYDDDDDDDDDKRGFKNPGKFSSIPVT
jgi:hypothetical protein